LTTHNHTAIAVGAAANAATINTPLGTIDAAIGNPASLGTVDKSALVPALNEVRNKALVGGIYVQQAQLVAWAEAGAYEMTAITYDGTYPSVIASAVVAWPDGNNTAGVFTATTINPTWEAIDAYTITHAASGYTVTQAAVTRNADGAITVKPAITIA
jgi:hypothetical protein